MVRARVALHNVKWQRLPGTTVAHVRITSFSKGVGEDLRKALKSLRKERLTGLILDLRNNPGGLLEEAVETASQFLSSGNVVLEKNAKGRIHRYPSDPGVWPRPYRWRYWSTAGPPALRKLSAGALQDARRATLVGEKTFGTGTVLNPFPLSDGSALLLAVEEWLTPAGHVIWHRGISPDVLVPLPPEASPVFPDVKKGMTAEELRQSKDEQLLRALGLLNRTVRD